MNAMREIRIDKVVVNIGVGEAGERLVKAQKVLEMVTGHKSVQTSSRTINRDWGIRKGMPIQGVRGYADSEKNVIDFVLKGIAREF